jgi:nuclear transport factor 2 (NTF2) superfamily protein
VLSFLVCTNGRGVVEVKDIHLVPASGNWFRSYGNENWEFDEHGLMRLRIASINDLPIEESERKYHWPLGRRPDDHPSLSKLGF